MSYLKFIDEVVNVLKKKVDEQLEIKYTTVCKNNGVNREGITIRKQNEIVSPNIYLDNYYDRYCEGEGLDEITDEILIFYEKAKLDCSFTKDDICDYSVIKDKIFFRLVNYEKNKEQLEDLPHIRYLDFAITFHYLLTQQKGSIQSYCINKRLQNNWEVQIDELYQVALHNTPKLFPASIQSMDQLLYDLLGRDLMEESLEASKAMDLLGITKSNKVPMYVMTNTKGVNGATTLIYPKLLKSLASKVETSLYLLPSSIHEWIVIPYDKEFEPTTLKNMVLEVNQTQVPEEEILSDEVYLYEKGTGIIERCFV
ncbi:MAG: hypothetical protein II992_09945 [Lachnospiraceae bacterium]|nr:hypothetical protein [Lachnospiraceae bacterium]